MEGSPVIRDELKRLDLGWKKLQSRVRLAKSQFFYISFLLSQNYIL